MKPSEFKKACRLYKLFQTRGEYETLAAKYGMSVCDLNLKCWQHFHDEKYAR